VCDWVAWHVPTWGLMLQNYCVRGRWTVGANNSVSDGRGHVRMESEGHVIWCDLLEQAGSRQGGVCMQCRPTRMDGRAQEGKDNRRECVRVRWLWCVSVARRRRFQFATASGTVDDEMCMSRRLCWACNIVLAVKKTLGYWALFSWTKFWLYYYSTFICIR